MNYNSLFLYNYGAELNVAKRYEKSITLLFESQEKFNDYDLQIVLANNYFHIGNITEAIKIYQSAENIYGNATIQPE